MEFTSVGFFLVCLFGVVERGVAAPAAGGGASIPLETQPAFGKGPSRRAARATSDPGNVLNFSLFLNFISPEDFGGTCFEGRTAGLGATTLTLEHRFLDDDDDDAEDWVEMQKNISLDVGRLQFSIAGNLTRQCVEYRLVQEEHGGGSCNCWSVREPSLIAGSVLSV